MKYKTILDHPYSFRFKKRGQLKQRVKQAQLTRFEKGNSYFRRQWYSVSVGKHFETYKELDFIN